VNHSRVDRCRAQGTSGQAVRWAWLALGLALLLGAGCASRPVQTSTGLPYRPGGEATFVPPQVVPVAPDRSGVIPPARQPSVPYDQLTATDWRLAASSWVGTKYRTGGTTRDGADCSGFAMSLHQEVTGIRLPRTTGQQYEQGQDIPVSGTRPGDLLFFQTLRGQDAISHVGVVVAPGEFAHAGTTTGVTFARFDQGYWQRRLVGARRFTR
jgi:cell wall-associated NlpC family hydrolase